MTRTYLPAISECYISNAEIITFLKTSNSLHLSSCKREGRDLLQYTRYFNYLIMNAVLFRITLQKERVNDIIRWYFRERQIFLTPIYIPRLDKGFLGVVSHLHSWSESTVNSWTNWSSTDFVVILCKMFLLKVITMRCGRLLIIVIHSDSAWDEM